MSRAEILVVEDNPGDVRLITQTFETRDLPGDLHAVQTGQAALDWLHRRRGYEESPRPDLILLDLNLPATSGAAVLEAIRSDPGLSTIPVIILTGSRSEDDVTAMYAAGANAYLMKPTDPIEFMDRLERFADFWLEEAALPPT